MKTILASSIAALAIGVCAHGYSDDYSVFKVCQDQRAVRTSDGADAGHIEYIVIDPADRQIVSTVVSGGVLGDRFVSIPFDDVTFPEGNTIVLNQIDRERLVGAPVFEQSRIAQGGRLEANLVKQSAGYFGGGRSGGSVGARAEGAPVPEGRRTDAAAAGREPGRAGNEPARVETEPNRPGNEAATPAQINAREEQRRAGEAARGNKADRVIGQVPTPEEQEAVRQGGEPARGGGSAAAESSRNAERATAVEQKSAEAARAGGSAEGGAEKPNPALEKSGGRAGAAATETPKNAGRTEGEEKKSAESARESGSAARREETGAEKSSRATEKPAEQSSKATEKRSEGGSELTK